MHIEQFKQTAFFHRWLRAADAMSPKESAEMLTCASRHLFARMLRTLRAEDCAPFTDAQLRVLYDALWIRLEVKAGKGLSSFWRARRWRDERDGVRRSVAPALNHNLGLAIVPPRILESLVRASLRLILILVPITVVSLLIVFLPNTPLPLLSFAGNVPESGQAAQTSLGFPRLAGFAFLALTSLLFFSILVLALFDDGRRLLVRLFYLTRRMFGVEVGARGLIQLGLYSALPALLVSFQQSFRQSQFDWHLFLTVFLVFTFVNVLLNVINQSMQFKRILSPGAGRVWRARRKAATAAIIQRINRHVAHTTATTSEVKTILKDLLDLIVLHVRDHQGNFREDRPRVFGNLLIEKGTDLVVVARDSSSYLPQYQRPIPAMYPKETLLCGRAMAAKKVVSVGNLVHSYPEGPSTKPYKSILAIPLFGAHGDAPYGALNVDCTELYFFDSFTPGKVENDLENSLQPYAHLITLTLEALVSTDRSVMISRLTGDLPSRHLEGGHS